MKSDPIVSVRISVLRDSVQNVIAKHFSEEIVGIMLEYAALTCEQKMDEHILSDLIYRYEMYDNQPNRSQIK